MELNLKPFDRKDLAEIFLLLKDIYTTVNSMSEPFKDKFPDEETCAKYFEGILNLPGAIVLFAKIKNKYTGYLIIKPRHQANIKHTSELNMGVHSEFRGKGIGKHLLSESLKQAKNSEIVEIIYLMVREDNTAAISLYKNFGFEKLAVLEKDTKIKGKYYSGILMRKYV